MRRSLSNTTNQDLNTQPLNSRLHDFLASLPENIQRPQSSGVVANQTGLNRAICQATAMPIEFPPLQDIVFPGDSVAVVLQKDLPNATSLLSAVLSELLGCNIEPTDVTIVVAREMAKQFGISADSFAGEFQLDHENSFHPIAISVHDDSDENSVCFLAADAKGNSIQVNRILFDADFVLPLGTPNAGENISSDCVYPEFSDKATKKRFQKGKNSDAVLRGEVRMANDNLGVFFVVQAITGRGSEVVDVIAGKRDDVLFAAKQKSDSLWNLETSPSSELILATIEKNPEDQTWEDFANAVATSDSVGGSGPIIIWSEINRQPLKEVREACDAAFEQGPAPKLSAPMRRLATILESRRVYLRSRLNQNTVEELGLGYFENENDVERLLSDCEHGILIRDAQRCIVGAEGQ